MDLPGHFKKGRDLKPVRTVIAGVTDRGAVKATGGVIGSRIVILTISYCQRKRQIAEIDKVAIIRFGRGVKEAENTIIRIFAVQITG